MKDINALTYDYSITIQEYTTKKIKELNQQYDIIDTEYSKTVDIIKNMEQASNFDKDVYNRLCDNTFIYSNLLDSIANYIETLKQIQKSVDIIDENIDYINEYLNDNIDSLKYKLGLL